MDIIEKIKMEEGDKAKMYKCPAGKWTIGAGINLEQQEMPEEVFFVWIDISGIVSDDAQTIGNITKYSGTEEFKIVAQLKGLQEIEFPQDVRDIWLAKIIFLNYKQIKPRLLDGFELPFDELNNDAQLVIQDMAYQMGVNGLFNFEKMLNAITTEDYETAADELLDSNYARQTPERAKRNADLLRGCA